MRRHMRNVYVCWQYDFSRLARAGLGRCHLAFSVANCVLNRRFAPVAVGSCDGLPARPANCNMTENALSILIVIFSVQLQQTKISDRKQFIFQHGFQGYQDISFWNIFRFRAYYSFTVCICNVFFTFIYATDVILNFRFLTKLLF